MGKPVSGVSLPQAGAGPVGMRGLGSASPVPGAPTMPGTATASLRPSNGPQLRPAAATPAGNALPVNQNALNYLNNWYDGTPAPWGAPAQPQAPQAAANPYQNNVVPRTVAPRWNQLNAGTPAPTTASLMQPHVVAPVQAPQQQNPNWGQLYGNGPNQFAQGFNPAAGNPQGMQFGPGIPGMWGGPAGQPRGPVAGTV